MANMPSPCKHGALLEQNEKDNRSIDPEYRG
jgi:hypothetical protein